MVISIFLQSAVLTAAICFSWFSNGAHSAQHRHPMVPYGIPAVIPVTQGHDSQAAPFYVVSPFVSSPKAPPIRENLNTTEEPIGRPGFQVLSLSLQTTPVVRVVET